MGFKGCCRHLCVTGLYSHSQKGDALSGRQVDRQRLVHCTLYTVFKHRPFDSEPRRGGGIKQSKRDHKNWKKCLFI